MSRIFEHNPSLVYQIIGLGKSGISAAKMLKQIGAEVIASDTKINDNLLKTKAELENLGVKIFLGDHHQALSLTFPQILGGNSPKISSPYQNRPCQIVLSPGIPPQSDVRRTIEEFNLAWIGELELAWHFSKGKTLVYTGSNGKTTITALSGLITKLSGKKSFACGNIGIPLSEIALDTNDDTYLSIEASSFQLEGIEHFHPLVSAISNITPDHILHHGSFPYYKQAKARVFMNQTSSDFLVYNADDKHVREIITTAKPHKIPVSLSDLTFGAYWQIPSYAKSNDSMEGELIWNLPDILNQKLRFPRKDLSLPGSHNVYNALIAGSAALVAGISTNVLERALREFKGVPHRLEKVSVINDVTYINDSKSTNPESGISALQAISSPIVLICGGQPKGGGFLSVKNLVKDKVKLLIAIGEAKEQLLSDLGDVVKNQSAETLTDAVTIAHKAANPGDVVLLSPMCASFDMFLNFEERGEQFRKIVMELQ